MNNYFWLVYAIGKATFKRVMNNKSRVFVWYLGSITVPLLMLFFWRNATPTANTLISLSDIQNYYLLYALLANFIICHPEDSLSRIYIRGGKLSEFLLRPIEPNLHFYSIEVAYRFFQLFFGILGMILLMILTGAKIQLEWSLHLLYIIPFLLLAQLIVYVFKLIIAYTSFYIFESDSIGDLLGVLLYLGCGSIAPLYLYPQQLVKILDYTPFPYIIYYPISFLVGSISLSAMLAMIPIYIIWISIFAFVAYLLWSNGLKIFATSS